MAYLFEPVAQFELPLTRKRDLLVDFLYKPLVVDVDGQPVLLNGKRQYVLANYPAGADVKLEIDADPPVSATATITGHHAEVLIDHLVTDPIKKGVPWRARITYVDGVDDVLCEGLTARPGPKGGE
jgi:hypothetical protein